MKEYLKMSDVFCGDYHAKRIHDENGNGFSFMLAHCLEAEYAAHAINSHDELVAEVERLRGSLTQCVNALYIAHKFCGNHTADECGDEIAIPISDALVAASNIVSE